MKIERVDHFVLTGERIRAEGEISYSRVIGGISPFGVQYYGIIRVGQNWWSGGAYGGYESP